MPPSRREEVAKILHVNVVLLLEDDAYISEFSEGLRNSLPRAASVASRRTRP